MCLLYKLIVSIYDFLYTRNREPKNKRKMCCISFKKSFLLKVHHWTTGSKIFKCFWISLFQLTFTEKQKHKRHLRIRPQTIGIHPQPRAKPLASHDARQRRPQPLRPTLCMLTAHTLSVWDIILKQKQSKTFAHRRDFYHYCCVENKGCSLFNVWWLLW